MRSVVALAVVLVLRATAAAEDPPADAPPAEAPPAPPPPETPEAPAPEPDEPALPEGLGDDTGEPPLPDGLATGTTTATAPKPRATTVEWRAVIDVRAGGRLRADPLERRMSLAEARAQLDLATSWRPWSTIAEVSLVGVGDPLADRYLPALETGDGALDVRTAAITMSPTSWLDVRIGRQILTWGTGDLVFLNDLFPKDWTAFLVGRHDEYLKAPSDAAKLSMFVAGTGLDVVATPRFDADRLPLRDRLSSWDPSTNQLAGQDDPLVVERPDRWFRDGELAARLHRTIGAWELAAYGYRGFWKSPAGFDPATGAATFPALAVWGASLRGPLLGGLGSAEGAYYDSRDDRGGGDPLIRNSELRGLVGYERQLTTGLTVGAQYNVEGMRHHGAYERTSPPGAPLADRVRHVATLRLTFSALRQRLLLSAFGFASPSDRDGYVRALASYALDDHWTMFAGANLLAGRDDHTLFGQFERDSNAYGGVRIAY